MGTRAIVVTLTLAVSAGGPLRAQTPQETFEARRKEAIANRQSPAGAGYEAVFVKQLFAAVPVLAGECASPPAVLPRNFDLALKLAADGRVLEALVDPESPFAICFKDAAAKRRHPAPPTPDYWTIVGLFLEPPPKLEAAPAAEPQQRSEAAAGRRLRATFIGNMAVHVTDGERAIVTDFPYEPGAFGYMDWTRSLVPEGPRPLCLITHSHDDHFAWKRAGEFCGSLLGPKDVVQRAGSSVAAVPLEPETRWNGIVIRPVATRHAGLEHYSYVVDWGGTRLYFSGDTDDANPLVKERGLAAAFVSPWMLRFLKESEAGIDARTVVVYHHQANEDVPEALGRIVPSQGQVLELGPR
jgi:hypothetical protein